MATILNKEVLRVTHALYRGRNIIVGIKPPDMLTFRLKGCHSKLSLSIAGAFDLAMKVEANHLMMQKKKEKEARKMGGLI